jgi:hypothetical protein
MLVHGMQSDDPAMRFASLNALRKITGRDLGVDAKPWVKLVEGQKGEALASRTGSPASTPSADPSAPPATAAPSAPAYPPPVTTRVLEDGATVPAATSPSGPRTFPQPR